MSSESKLFPTILASTVHDMKNSLGLVLVQINQVAERLDQTDQDTHRIVGSLRYEASRINLSLMQLLALYKIDNGQLDIRPMEVEIADFLGDCAASLSQLAAQRCVDITIECEPMLVGYFDADLVEIALNNVLGNSIRYTQSQIKLSARLEADRTCFTVSDDGAGYPEAMLQDPGHYIRRVNRSTGSTGLGLFFADTIAKMHQRLGKSGNILLFNGGEMNGGNFQLLLP